MKEWRDMTVRELKAKLKEYNLPQTGNKTELLERLIHIPTENVSDEVSSTSKYVVIGNILERSMSDKKQLISVAITGLILLGLSGGAMIYSDEILKLVSDDVEYELIDFDTIQSKNFAQNLVNLGHPEWEGRLSGTIEEKNTAESIKFNFSEMGIPSTLEEFTVPMFEMGNQFELSVCKPGDVGEIFAGPSPCSFADINREIIEFIHTEDYVVQGYSGSIDVRHTTDTKIFDLNTGSENEDWSGASEGIGLVLLRDGSSNDSETDSNTVLFSRAQENQLLGLILINEKTNCDELIQNDCVPYFKSLDVEKFTNIPENIGLIMVSKSVGQYLKDEVIDGESRIQMIIDVQNQGTGTIYVPCGIIEGKTDEIIIFGAHHDTVYNGQGAVDNTAGTATIQEIARQFGELMTKLGEPHYNIWFCTWGGEEEGLWGSSEWVKKHQEELEENLRTYINLDMNHVDAERNGGVTLFGNNKQDVAHIKKIVKIFKKEYTEISDKYLIEVRDIDSEDMPNNSDHAPFVFGIGEEKYGDALVCYGSGSSEYHTYLDTMDRFNEESLAISGIIYGSFVRYLSYN